VFQPVFSYPAMFRFQINQRDVLPLLQQCRYAGCS
jgi:hypothetical protein